MTWRHSGYKYSNLEDYGEQTKKISIFDKYCTFPILVNIVLSMGLGQSELIGANRIMIRMTVSHISLIGF